MDKINQVIGKFIRGIAFVWEYVVLKSIYTISFRLNFPRFSALILVLLTKRLNGKKKYRVLCMGRSQFKDDIHALITFGNNIQYIYFHKILLGKIVRSLIPFSLDKSLLSLPYAEVSQASFDDGCTYHIDPKYKRGKEKTYKYMSKMFPILQRFLKFDAVMSGNYVYVDQQEFFKICEERGIPGIILNKEGLGAYSLGPGEYWPGIKGCRFVGTKMLYINKLYKEQEVRTLMGLAEKNAIVVGAPRFDYYFHCKKRNLKQVVLFLFEVSEYLSLTHMTNEMLKKITSLSEDFHKHVIEFALNHQDYKVVIKMKSGDMYIKYIQDIYDRYFKKIQIDNLKITNTKKVKNLILDSRVVLGFNSTALIEALVADKLVITPYLSAELPDQMSFDLFEDYEDLVNYANDYDKIEDIILNYKDYKLPDTDRKIKFMEPLIFKADGMASLRAERAIVDTIEERKMI